MHQAIRKNMAALWVGAKLNFINSDKIRAHSLGHCFNCTDPILRSGWYNALFTRDKSHNRGASCSNNFIINFARQKPQRKADNTGFMAQHTLYSIMGFAGICWTQHSHGPRLLYHF